MEFQLEIVRRTLPMQKNTKRKLPDDSSNTGGSKIKNQPNRDEVADFQQVTLIYHLELIIFFIIFYYLLN